MSEKFSFYADKVIKGILFSAVPAGAFYLMEAYEHNPFKEVRPTPQFLNIVLFEFIAWILVALIGDGKWALRIELFVTMIFGLVNHYVMAFRSTPFVPWDIFSIKTASSVASNYDFTPTTRVTVVTLVFIALIVLSFLIRFRIQIKWYFRLIPAVIISICLGLFVNALQNEDFQNKNDLYPFLFTPVYMTQVNGMAVTFAMDLAYVAVDKPQGYSATKAAEDIEKYAGADAGTAADAGNSEAGSTGAGNSGAESVDSGELPNVIVIMDEAFSDLGVLGDLVTNKDYMPYVHSLQQGAENTITGNLNVSVCGGNTANSEYEFLTGNSMAFLPVGSIPYQQYMKGESDSLARYMKSLGYNTYAQHPYFASGWCRDKVYPNMGFDDSDFKEEYINPTMLRSYVSDESDFDHIIRTFENKPKDKPAFIFNVTMQNHGGYSDQYMNFIPDVKAQGMSSEPLNQYLSLVKRTDSELERIIKYFSEVDEKTVLVFFGDHQPNDFIASNVLAKNGKDYRNLSQEDLHKRYQVPYVIWANYDIGEATNQETSLNYLGAEVLKVAGIPTSPYQNYLLELKKKLPLISAVRTEWNGEEDEETLLQYRRLAYYKLFDWEKE